VLGAARLRAARAALSFAAGIAHADVGERGSMPPPTDLAIPSSA